jgi:hypothetical protein
MYAVHVREEIALGCQPLHRTVAIPDDAP